MFSFGKTMHATGWRVGYTVAPAAITREIRRVHQFNTFSIAAPLQHAIADFLKKCARAQRQPGASSTSASATGSSSCLRNSSFSWTPASADVFPAARLQRDLARQSDVEFADTLLREAGVAVDTDLAVLRQRHRS